MHFSIPSYLSYSYLQSIIAQWLYVQYNIISKPYSTPVLGNRTAWVGKLYRQKRDRYLRCSHQCLKPLFVSTWFIPETASTSHLIDCSLASYRARIQLWSFCYRGAVMWNSCCMESLQVIFFLNIVKRIMDNTVYIHVVGECTETLV